MRKYEWHVDSYRTFWRYRVKRYTYHDALGSYYRLDTKRFWTLKAAQARADELNALAGASHG